MEDKLTVITIGEKSWLGILKEEGGKTVLEDAVPWSGTAFSSWIIARNLGELTRVVISPSAGYTERPLLTDEKMTFRRRLEDMEEVKRTAMARLENSYFSK